jgi:hypothetical protein
MIDDDPTVCETTKYNSTISGIANDNGTPRRPPFAELLCARPPQSTSSRPHRARRSPGRSPYVGKPVTAASYQHATRGSTRQRLNQGVCRTLRERQPQRTGVHGFRKSRTRQCDYGITHRHQRAVADGIKLKSTRHAQCAETCRVASS